MSPYILGIGILDVWRVEFVERKEGDFSGQLLFVHDGEDLGGCPVIVHYHMKQSVQ